MNLTDTEPGATMGGRGVSTYRDFRGQKDPDLDSEYTPWDLLAHPPVKNPEYWSQEAREAWQAEHPDWQAPDPGETLERGEWGDHDYESWEHRYPGWFEEHGLENPDPKPELPPIYQPDPEEEVEWFALQSAIQNAMDSDTISNLVFDYVEPRTGTSNVIFHDRLFDPEPLAPVQLRDVLVRYPSLMTPDIEKILVDIITRPLPPMVKPHIQEIYITQQTPKPKDPKNTRINEPFIIAEHQAGDLDPQWWEIAYGERLTLNLWGMLSPPAYSAYRALLDAGEELPINDAAYDSHAEDFRQSLILYLTNPASLQSIAPERFKIIARIVTDPDFHG